MIWKFWKLKKCIFCMNRFEVNDNTLTIEYGYKGNKKGKVYVCPNCENDIQEMVGNKMEEYNDQPI